MEVHTLSLAGAWRLIAFEFRKPDGEVIYPFGRAARGSIIYTESGRYAAQLMRKDRPRFASGDQMTGTVEEIEANYKGCISYFGTYELDLENRIVTHHVEGSIFPNMEGRDQIRESGRAALGAGWLVMRSLGVYHGRMVRVLELLHGP